MLAEHREAIVAPAQAGRLCYMGRYDLEGCGRFQQIVYPIGG